MDNAQKGNYSEYYKDIKNSPPVKTANSLTRGLQNYFSKFLSGREYDKICEYGCGPGMNVKYLLQYCEKLDCFDIEESLAPHVIGRVGGERVEFNVLVEDDKSTQKPDEIYDAIYSTEVLEHVYWPRVAVKEMYRILKKNGCVFISVPYHGFLKNLAITFFYFNKHFSPDNPHIRFFTKKTLCGLFISEGFSVKHIGSWGRITSIFPKSLCAIFHKK